MNIHCLQHAAFEGPGSIGAWARARGHAFAVTRLDLGARLPALDEVDLLAVMGGPMSVHDEGRHPWLVPEKRFLGRALAAGRRVLGVCLGAQLLAHVLGARVHPNPEKEIGWFPVEAMPAARGTRLFAGFPPRLEVFHWHGETFDLPAGAVHVARSAGCEHQAFVLGDTVAGLQFHLEMTAEGACDLLAHGAGELTGGPFVQGPEAIRGDGGRFATIHRAMADLLDRLVEGGSAGQGGST